MKPLKVKMTSSKLFRPKHFRPTVKTVAILILLSAIVTWASFSFAGTLRTITLAGAKFQYNSQTRIMRVSGRLPNPCTVEPHPVLVPTNNPKTLMLQIDAEQTSHICEIMLGGKYNLAFDVRSLKFELLNLRLNTSGVYKIITADHSVSFALDFSSVPFTRPFATNVVSNAYLTLAQDGRFVIASPNGVLLLMDSPLINLNDFINQNVEVEGHIINTSRPGFSITQPLTKQLTKQPMVILVTGLSSTSN